MTIDITPKAVERLAGPRTHICWTPDGIPKHMQELVVLLRASDLDALSAALTASQAETAAAFAIATHDLDLWAKNLREDGFSNAAPFLIEKCSDIIRDLTTADSKAALDRIIAEAVSPYQEALIFCSGSADFGEGGVARVGWNKLCAPLIAAIPKGTPHD